MEFSELAIAKLLQLFPELSSVIVTFKDITNEVPSLEDTDIGIGVFILQVGSSSYYLPIIRKGDAIQPLDSLFDNEEQCFIPLTKGFVTKLINSSQSEMGKPTKIPNTVAHNPSIYSLVTPPRTGKFVYASSSKLEGFLSILPNEVKSEVLEKFSSDKDIYSTLHKLFGLENLFSALKPTVATVVATPRPAVELITEGTGLDNKTINDILNKGYSLRGENTTNRIAVQANDFAAMGKLRTVSSIDSGQDFDICMATGETASAFIPSNAKYAPKTPVLLRSKISSDPIIAIFQDGTYTVTPGLVATGEGRKEFKVLKDVLNLFPGITPMELSNQDNSFAVFSPDLELVGLFRHPKVTKTAYGVTIQANSAVSDELVMINAYKNCTTINCERLDNIFIPTNTLIVKLRHCLYQDKFEININSAAARLELSTLTALGTAINIGHDGVEFLINRRPIGNEVSAMEVLVIKEGISPEKAGMFLKQAKEQKHVKVYMSKKADAEQDLMPSYGDAPPGQQPGFGINGDFGNNLSAAVGTNDAEVIESTIISELLQVADLKGYIKEYLPEIKNSIDKLGRTLFLCRLKMDQLALDHTASEVFSFISNMRNTYRILGDSYIKLENMVADSEVKAEDK
jgi:hypothetical protein